MRPPFPSSKSYLQLYVSDVYAGLNKKNVRDSFVPSSQGTLYNTFVVNSTKVYGSWSVDGGDLTMQKAEREPRSFAEKGKISFTFTGTSLYARVQLNYGWGTASIKIDGMDPTAISGVTNAINSISCDTEAYAAHAGQPPACIDVLIADNLPTGQHTVEFVANNANDKWFAIVGIKNRSYNSVSSSKFRLFKTPITSGLNKNQIDVVNEGSSTVSNITIVPGPGFVSQNGTPLVVPATNLAPAEKISIPFAVQPLAVGSGNLQLTITADYEDSSGTTALSTTTVSTVDSTALVFGAGWTKDSSAPGGVRRAFSTGASKKVSFQTTATTFDIEVMREYGWGAANVMIGATSYGQVTSNDSVGGGFLKTLTVTGLPTGSKTIDLVSVNAAAKPFVFTKITTVESKMHSRVTEVVSLPYESQNVPPVVPASTRIRNGEIKFDQNNPSVLDYNTTNPRANTNILEYNTYARFPTYCVYYQQGKNEILNTYDLVIVDPGAVTRKQVKAWQDRGIRVIGYVSVGEEDGERTNIWDLSADVQGPHKDDGKGVGGYASYYNKGGNLFGESSECGHDKQRVYGSKTCELSRAEYYTGAGRCSKACQYDWRDGYASQVIGGACGKGFTSANNWKRDAMSACSNVGCPQYTPLNKKCPQWTQSEVCWGQDFAIADANYPDQNGIWASTFINPLAPRWKEKLATHYFPVVLNAQQPFNETVTLQSQTTSAGAKLCFRIANYPFDVDEPLALTNEAGTHTYVENLDYSYDAVSGVFTVEATAGTDVGLAAPAVGTKLKIQYTKKGLECDGVFMDTVDTVDVYPSAAFQQAMVDVIAHLKSIWPNKLFVSNRGFSVLDSTIKYCEYVMFESFLADYNWETDVYSIITNQDTIDWNNGIKQQLRDLRKNYVFDVLALNYCDNGPPGDTMRNYITQECLKEGYMSWTSTILLNDPLPNNPYALTTGRIRTNMWKKLRSTRHV